MSRIDRINRQIIERLKESCTMKIEMVSQETEITVRGDKQFAHDVAIAYQALVLRKAKEQERLSAINNNRGDKDASPCESEFSY